ncbi:MAG: head GIN domain-containing protein [Verrucomicrobiales bacterium]
MIEGSGTALTDEREIEHFQCIDLHLPAEVNIRRGDRQAVRVTADENVLPLIATTVMNGTLRIVSNVQFKPVTAIGIEIEIPTLSGVNVHGSGNVRLDSVTDNELSLVINGSGNITGKGTVKTLHAISNGSGNLLLKHLTAQTGQVATNGSGNAEINVTSTLAASISSSGNITCHGAPGTVKSQNAGSGQLEFC